MNLRKAVPARTRVNRTLPFVVSGILALASLQSAGAVQATAAAYPATDYTAPLTVDQVDQLVAPIALYPDELVAEVLAAATYPTEVVEADRWMGTNAELKGNALADAVNAQPWADSVKALTQFPSVLAMMDKNLSWTASLGGAYMRDSQSVMNAVQQMRARAEQAGNLKSTPQESVTNDGQTIIVEPTDPEVIYVPEYDPWFVYGAPIGFYPDWIGIPGLYIDEPGIFFGLGIGIGLFGDFGWGWDHWRPDWYHHGIYFDHRPYVSHGLTFDHHAPEAFGRFSGIGHAAGFGHAGGFGRAGGFGPVGGFGRAGGFGQVGGFGHAAGFGQFDSFDHGAGFAGGFHPGGFAAAGGARFGGFRGAGGGFHGGGFGGGGFHGGGFGGGGFHGGGGVHR